MFYSADDNYPRREEREVAPRAAELSRIIYGVNVEKRQLTQAGRPDIRNVQNTEAASVISLVGAAAAYVEVVVDGRALASVNARHRRSIQVGDIPSVSSGIYARISFVKLVVE